MQIQPSLDPRYWNQSNISLAMALQAAVPIKIKEYQANPILMLEDFANRDRIVAAIANEGDSILFSDSNTSENFVSLVKGLALCAVNAAPKGVTFCGLTFIPW